MNNALQRHLFDFDRVHILSGNRFAPPSCSQKGKSHRCKASPEYPASRLLAVSILECHLWAFIELKLKSNRYIFRLGI